MVCQARWHRSRRLACKVRKPRSNRISVLRPRQSSSTEPQPLAGRCVLTTRWCATLARRRSAPPTARHNADVRTHTQMSPHHSSTPQSHAICGAWASTQGERSARSVRSLIAGAGEAFTMQHPKAAQQSHCSAEVSSELERRTTAAGWPQRSNSALLTDTYASPLRARHGAAKRER